MQQPKSIAVLLQASQKEFIIEFAAHAKKQSDCAVHGYCDSMETVKAYRPLVEAGIFDSVTIFERTPAEFPQNLDAEVVMRVARDNEERLDRPMNWYALVNRHFGRGFSPQAFYHPRSRASENSDYVQFVNHMNTQIAFWDEQFISKKLDVILNADFLQASVARHHGAKVRTFLSARLRNLFIWATDEYWESDLLKKAFNETMPDDTLVSIEAGPYGQGQYAKVAAKATTVSYMLERIFKRLKRHVYLRLKGYQPSYDLWPELRMIWRQLRYTRKIIGPKTVSLDDLDGQPFVFFPLQVEPERNFQGGSPEYFYQQSAIISVARDLPAGFKIAVKEHFPAAGKRMSEFYDQLLDLKNLVLIDSREPGVAVIKKATAVATVNSTAGMEAAIMGKPVVTFGRHNMYNMMSHVYVVGDESNLRCVLSRILTEPFDQGTALAEGARFVKALQNVTVDMGDFSAFNRTGYGDMAVVEAYDALCASFEYP